MHLKKCVKLPGRPREGKQTLGFSATSMFPFLFWACLVHVKTHFHASLEIRRAGNVQKVINKEQLK